MKVKVKVPAQRKVPQKKETKDLGMWTDVPPVKKDVGLFAKCLRIIREDIHDGMNGGRSSRQEKKEKYQQFVELAKGGKL